MQTASDDQLNIRLYEQCDDPFRSGNTQVGEFGFYRDQLWTAPELLRMTTRPINGTQKADVYSFAIVLQEIVFRTQPYFIDIEPPHGMNGS